MDRNRAGRRAASPAGRGKIGTAGSDEEWNAEQQIALHPRHCHPPPYRFGNPGKHLQRSRGAEVLFYPNHPESQEI